MSWFNKKDGTANAPQGSAPIAPRPATSGLGDPESFDEKMARDKQERAIASDEEWRRRAEVAAHKKQAEEAAIQSRDAARAAYGVEARKDPSLLWFPSADWLNAKANFRAADLLGRAVLLIAFRVDQPLAFERWLTLAERVHRRLKTFGCAAVALHVGKPIEGVEPHVAYEPFAKALQLTLPIGFVRREELKADPSLIVAGPNPKLQLYGLDGQRVGSSLSPELEDVGLGAHLTAIMWRAKLEAAAVPVPDHLKVG